MFYYIELLTITFFEICYMVHLTLPIFLVYNNKSSIFYNNLQLRKPTSNEYIETESKIQPLTNNNMLGCYCFI